MFVAVVVRCPDSVGVKCSDERPLCAAIRTEHCTPNGVRAATMFLLYKHCTPTEFANVLRFKPRLTCVRPG